MEQRQKQEGTRRRQTELGLSEAQVREQTLLSRLPGIVIASDREGVLTALSGSGVTGLSLSPGELVGCSVYEVFRECPALLAGFRVALSGAAFEGSCELGGVLYDARLVPIRDDEGLILEVVGLCLDGGERLRQSADAREAPLDLAAVRPQLLRADQLANLGALLAGVGHELNNTATMLSGVIVGLQDAAEEQRLPDAELAVDLQIAFDQLAAQGTQLMHLAQTRNGRSDCLDLSSAVHATLDMLRQTGRTKYVKVTRDISEVPVRCTFDRSQMEQLVINLVDNAVDAVQEAGAGSRGVRVRVWGEGRQCKLSVEDDGPGIPLDLRSSIFRAYFTTKAPGRGTGLGLHAAREIAEGFGGTLRVEGEPGKGARFVLDLPQTPAVAVAA